LHSLDPRTHLLVGLAGKAAGVPVRLASVGGDGRVWGSERLGALQDGLLAKLLSAAFVSEAGQREVRRVSLSPLELRVVPSAARLLEEYGHLLEGVGV
jgi:DNA helicase HerA-like ATPase